MEYLADAVRRVSQLQVAVELERFTGLGHHSQLTTDPRVIVPALGDLVGLLPTPPYNSASILLEQNSVSPWGACGRL